MFTVDNVGPLDGPWVGCSDGEGVAMVGWLVFCLCSACWSSSRVGDIVKVGAGVDVAHALVVLHGCVVGRTAVAGFNV